MNINSCVRVFFILLLHKKNFCAIITFAVKKEGEKMKKIDLGTEKISKLLISFSIPCIISMLINSVYNIVDQIFIGQGVGYLGNAATNIIFPLVIICTALASIVGNGCAAELSLKLGEGKKSIAYSLIFRDKQKSLSDDEVNPVMEEIIKELEEKFEAILRK